MKRIISILISICLIMSANAAAAQRAEKGEEIGEENIHNTSKELDIYGIFGDVDNSEVEVDVVWQKGDNKRVIYSGKLGGYAFGIYKYIDFTGIEYQVIFTTIGITDDVIYIVPKSEKDIKDVMDELTPDGDGKFTESTEADDKPNMGESTLKCDVNLMYDGIYREKIMIKNRQLSVPIKITNTGSEPKDIKCRIGEYDEKGMMIGETESSLLRVGANTAVAVTLNREFNESAESAKIFIWESGTMRPITNSIQLTETDADYYADSMEDAQEYDITHPIEGNINTDGDVDYIKFAPKTSGIYTFNCIGTSKVMLALYNSDNTKISSNSGNEYSLTTNQTYYVKIYASSGTGEYVLNARYGKDTDDREFDVYDFDISANIIKNNIYGQCGNLYDGNPEAAKEIYEESQRLLMEDIRLHKLPEFLKNGNKNITNYDTLVNEYLSIKADKFYELYEKYENLLNKANNTPEIRETAAETTSENINQGEVMFDNIKCPPISAKGETLAVDNAGNVTIVKKDDDAEMSADKDDWFEVKTEYEIIPSIENEKSSISAAATAALNIQSKSASTITFSVRYPTGAKLRAMYIYNFNTTDGLTQYAPLWKDGSNPKTNVNDGTYTISGLTPGGIYIIAAMWGYSTSGQYGGENTINRWSQLPYSKEETLEEYTGKYVSAAIEEEDAAKAQTADIEKWLLNMDKVYKELQSFTGYTPYKGKKIKLASSRDDFSANQPDGENYWRLITGLSGNPVKISQPFYRSHMRRLSRNDWGDTAIHELSHDFDNDNWIFDHEALAFLKTAYIIEKLNAKVYRIDTEKWYTGSGYATFLKTDWFEGYRETFEKGIYSPAGLASILLEIKKEIGWEAFSKTFKYMGELSWEQLPDTELDIFNLFLTCLGKSSNKNVYNMISERDKNILAENFGGSIEEYMPPIADVPGGASGRIADISVQKGEYKQYRFVPQTTGKYKIYTGPYGGTGAPNDTYIEVYTENTETGEPIGVNDDNGGSVFSSINLDLIQGQVYYIKVYNNNQNNARLHARLYIMGSENAAVLEEDKPQNVVAASTEYKAYKFTPGETGVYVFTADGYGGEEQTYDTYIKLYNNGDYTEMNGGNEKKIVAKLTEGHTYYLQFSGFLMRAASGRITVSKGRTIQFTKRNDSSFIYVNNPEYIANQDIIDDVGTRNYKLFEQKNVYDKNTYYQTHLSWYNSDKNAEYYPKQNQFYVGIDFYNPNTYAVSVDVSNLVATGNKTHLQNYINKEGENPETITIQPQQHAQLFDYTTDRFKCVKAGDTPSLFIIFDFDVKKATGASIPDGQGITVSSLAAYDYEKMRLKDGEENTLVYQNASINNGNVLYGTVRPSENDLEIKYKGIARNQANQIDASLDIVIDDNTSGDIPFALRDTGNLINGYYAKEQADWNVQINPINDSNEALLHTTADNLHRFKYHFSDSKTWYFDYLHRNTDYLTLGNDGIDSINQEVPQSVVDAARESVASGAKQGGARDENALQMGSWGVVYHYTVTVNNMGTRTKKVKYRVITTAHYTLIGMREDSKSKYLFKDTGTDVNYQIPFETEVPPGQKTFEIVTMCGGGNGGLQSTIIVE